METKHCNKCNESFEVPVLGEKNEHWRWSKAKEVKGGYRLRCLISHRKNQLNYRGTPEKYAKYIFLHIKERCNGKVAAYRGKLHITKEEFLEWAVPTLEAYVAENNVTDLAKSRASIDKIDDDIGYKLGNLRWISAQENIQKGADKKRVPIRQLTMEGVLVKEWDSVNQTKEGGFSPGNVTYTCQGKFKQYKGFKWEYRDKK
jgi:hypothetical protein